MGVQSPSTLPSVSTDCESMYSFAMFTRVSWGAHVNELDVQMSLMENPIEMSVKEYANLTLDTLAVF